MGGVHGSSIYRWIKEGTFPASHKIGTTTARWKRSEVEAAREKMMATQDLSDIASQLQRMGREVAAMYRSPEAAGDTEGMARLQDLRRFFVQDGAPT